LWLALCDVALHVLIYLELPLRQIEVPARGENVICAARKQTQDSSVALALNTKGAVVRCTPAQGRKTSAS
jgi:hypothetical protein